VAKGVLRVKAVECSIVPVCGAGSDLDTARNLFLEYGDSLGFNTCFGGYEQELATLPGDYAPPRGALLLARVDDAPAGCIALRPVDSDTGEIKRLFVRPQFRRNGIGRTLAEQAIVLARAAGCRRVCLDTLPTMPEARALYAALGFKRCAPYYDNSCIGSDCFALELSVGRLSQ
jgi:putative acetyltransferase